MCTIQKFDGPVNERVSQDVNAVNRLICNLLNPTACPQVVLALTLAATLMGLIPQAKAGIPPLNDAFISASVLVGKTGSREAENVDATKDLNEPNHANGGGSHSVWFTWHCSSGGTFELKVENASFPYSVAAYVGKELTALTPIASAQNGSITFNLAPGVVYRFAVDGIGDASGSFTLKWNQNFLPNGGPDLYVPRDRIKLNVIEQNFPAADCEVEEGCTVAGTRRLMRFDMYTYNIGKEDLVYGAPPDSPLFHYASCHNHYHFEALASYKILTLSNDVVRVGNKLGFCLEDVEWSPQANSQVKKFNCDNQGIQAGWGDIYNWDLPCQYIDLTGLPEGEYVLQIILDPQNQIPESNEDNNELRIGFHLQDRCSTPPANDAFLAAEELTGTSLTVIGDTTCATQQRAAGEPNHSWSNGSRASKSIWYRWTAPYSGETTISTEGSSFDTVLGVYIGTKFDDFKTSNSPNLVAQGDDIAAPYNLQSKVVFNATAGTVYNIAVDGNNPGSGAQGGIVLLSINPNMNNDFDACRELTGPVGELQGSIMRGTREEGEPNHAGQPGGNSLWYCWTAPADGPVAFDSVGSDFDSLLAVYTGDAVDDLTQVAADDDSGGYQTSRVQFDAIKNTIYQIAVDRKLGTNAPFSSGLLHLRWRMADQAIAPIITQGPRSQATFVGSNVVMNVSAVGSIPLGYQWFHDAGPVENGGNINGAQSSTLTIQNLADADRGIYWVVVSNSVGAVSSGHINLVVASVQRVLYVDPLQSPPNSDVDVRIYLTAQGGEHAAQFSLMYDPALILSPTVALDPGLPAGTTLETDFSLAPMGEIGIRITLPGNQVLSAGSLPLLTVHAGLVANVTQGQRVSICPTDNPFVRSITGLGETPLAASFACGNIIVLSKEQLSARITQEGVELTLLGLGGAFYEFQFSIDLENWTSMGNQFNASGTLVVLDNANHGSNRCFYRAIRK